MEKPRENRESSIEGGIDSEQIINTWIDNASRIWDSVEKKMKNTSENGEETIFKSRDAAKNAYKAWEPAMKTWNEFASKMNKKEMIEKSASGRITFVESTRNLDDVAGHSEAKAWLRQDADLMKRGKIKALPMGYLINGRIGTGKTYLVECFSGEAGVPCVEIKNFRDKWVGATEGNLEAIFKILHAMGQVIVFIDEADQVAGKRDGGSGDSGVSGRIYAMLAREMADTRNRGRIFWIFARSGRASCRERV